MTNCFIGYFGDEEDDLNEALLQASAVFELKITPRATAPSLAFAPSRAPGSVYNTLHPLQPNPLLLLVHPYICIAKNTSVALQNYTMVLQELEPRY